MTRSSVVLPQPDGPMKETNSPLEMDSEMPDSASTGPSLVWKVSDRSRADTTGAGVPAAACGPA